MSDTGRAQNEAKLSSLAAMEPADCAARGTSEEGLSGGQCQEACHELSPSQRVSITEQLVDDFHEPVYRYLYWLTGCRATAEDITQDVFTRAFRGVHNLRERAAAKPWLLRIARNEFSRWCTKKKTKAAGTFGDDDLQVDFDSPDERDQESLNDNVEWVQRGLSDLSSEFRVVLLMYYFEQKSYTEIAQELEIPIGTVMSRLNRGRQKLKDSLARLAEPTRKGASQGGTE